jgi:hypothetical protein
MSATKLEILRDRLALRATFPDQDEISVAVELVARVADWLDLETDGVRRASAKGRQPSLRDVLHRALSREGYAQEHAIVFECRTPAKSTATKLTKANGK